MARALWEKLHEVGLSQHACYLRPANLEDVFLKLDWEEGRRMKAAIGILKRHLIVFRRTLWSNMVFNVLEPFLYLSAMGFGLGAFVQDMGGMSYIQFIAPGMVASAAMWAATFECTYSSFVRLHYQKTFHAMLAGPATVGDVVIGEVLFGIVKNIVFRNCDFSSDRYYGAGTISYGLY